MEGLHSNKAKCLGRKINFTPFRIGENGNSERVRLKEKSRGEKRPF